MSVVAEASRGKWVAACEGRIYDRDIRPVHTVIVPAPSPPAIVPGRRAVVLDGPGRVRLAERSPARAGAGVRVRPLGVGLCGSDVHGYLGRTGRRAPGTVMGHELCARVADATSDLDGRLVAVDPVRSCGACRACRSGAANRCAERRCTPELPGGFADVMTVDRANLVPVAGDADPALIALVEPLAVGVHAVARAAVAGRAVAVLGAGAIGLGAGLAARRAGAGAVVVVERSPRRRALAHALGLDTVAPEGLAAGAFEVCLECVGTECTTRAAIETVEPGGTVVAVGLGETAWSVPAAELVMGERTLTGSAVYTREEFTATARWLEAHAALVAPLVQRRIPLEELPSVLEAHASGEEQPVRTVVVQEDG